MPDALLFRTDRDAIMHSIGESSFLNLYISIVIGDHTVLYRRRKLLHLRDGIIYHKRHAYQTSIKL